MDRRKILTLALALSLGSSGATLFADTVTVTGEVIETSCYIRTGARGVSHRKCAEICAKAGIPLALLEDGTEQVIWLAAADHQQSANKQLLPHVARRVAISGQFVERGGARLLIIESIEPVR